jgi:hypothetical protein
MTTITYKVAADAGQWSVARNGEPGVSYAAQEVAFEVAVGEAGGDLRTGHDIVIQVTAATDPSGAVDGGGKPMSGDGFHI